MYTMNKFIKNQDGDSFDIDGDFSLFQKILKDMDVNGGALTPAENWGVEIGGHNGGDYFHGKDITRFNNLSELYEARYATMKKMMDPWIGSTGMQSVSTQVLQDYLPFLKAIDYLDIVGHYIHKDGSLKNSAENMLITDLGTIIDLNLIHLFTKSLEQIRILEIGGGYGRLAEAALRMFGPGQVNIVLVDSVPASLLYSYRYLSRHFPDLKIGFYYEDPDFSLDEYDCYIMPSWHFERLNKHTYNVCCNIQSMQEMNQFHVDYYLNLFDKVITPNGMIYLSNEKDYVFSGLWNYPSRWKNVLKLRTPRSWTRNSPTEIFKLSDTVSEASEIAELQYHCQLFDFDKNKELTNTIANLQSRLKEMELLPESDSNASSNPTPEIHTPPPTETNLSLKMLILIFKSKLKIFFQPGPLKTKNEQ